MEERMDLKLQAVEQRLERKIVNTSLINVVATCTILGLVITILTSPLSAYIQSPFRLPPQKPPLFTLPEVLAYFLAGPSPAPDHPTQILF